MKINFEDALSQKEIEYVSEIRKIAESHALKTFLIGGMVRDIILGKKNHDIDITIDGDAMLVAEEFSNSFQGKWLKYEQFLTATVFIDGYSIDFASLRKEIYESPGALPIVSRGSFETEILRRDFTINTLALSLHKDSLGELIDLRNGLEDLCKGCIRVLHKNSFLDDPTRIFRAARFVGRFGYRLDNLSSKLLKTAVFRDVFKSISAQRISNELRIILREENVVEILNFMGKYKIFEKISKDIHYNKKMRWMIRKLTTIKNLENRELYLYLVLLYQTKEENLLEEINVFCPEKKLRAECLKLVYIKKDFSDLNEKYNSLSNYEIYQTLMLYSRESILVLKASGDFKNAVHICRRYFLAQKQSKIFTTGRELKEFDIYPGKIFRVILEKIREKKINGEIKGRKDEILYLKKEIKNLAKD